MRKPPHEMDFLERKSDLIKHLFISPGDQDYLTARWAYQNSMFHNFYWCASQAMEKYLKGALLYQDLPTLDYGHNIEKLYADVIKLDSGQFIHSKIDLPNTTGMGQDNWQDKPIAQFIQYLADLGSPDNRYGFIGTYVIGPDIHVVDRLSMSLRKFMRNTNFFGRDLYKTVELRSRGTNTPLDWMLDADLLLERLYFENYHVGESRKLRDVFSNMNIAFISERRPDESTFGGQHVASSRLYVHLVHCKKLDNSDKNLSTISQLGCWVDDNIKLPKKFRKSLELP